MQRTHRGIGPESNCCSTACPHGAVRIAHGNVWSRPCVFAVFVAFLAHIAGCATPPKATRPARLQGESVPVFRAEDLLPPETVYGLNYRISNRVPVEEYRYSFVIESEFGDISARGMEMLDLRLHELHSIEQARKLSTDPQLVDGILDRLEQTGKGLVTLITDPLGSAARAPRGFARMVNAYVDPADRRAGSKTRRMLAAQLACDPETSNPVL